jgi:tRNA1(Val) A37 N6-methylase TrmN6
MMSDEAMPSLTRDRWYGGRVVISQPAKGFRATTDAILLAAAIPKNTQHVLELGAGIGAASLALAIRLTSLQITAVEGDDMIAALLELNITENDLSDRITAYCDDALMPAPPWEGRHDLVMINPPYNDISSTLSEDERRQKAMAVDNLVAWIDAAACALVQKGRLVMISRADRVDELISGLGHAFGDLSMRSVHTLPDHPAKRVLISGRKGVVGPATILPSLTLHVKPDILTDEMAAISDDKAAINMIPPGRHLAKLRLPPSLA